jgi:uncharacterized protein (DUF1697 family)
VSANASQTAFVALLRAVNVGGTGKLPMAELKKIAEDLGFGSPRTFIASGNLLFTSGKTEAAVCKALESALEKHMGKAVGVVVRTAKEMAAVANANPFKDSPPNRVLAIFLPRKPPKDALEGVRGQSDEKLVLGKREIYVDYGELGAGRSKLKIPAAAAGTARNMNSVAKLADMAKELA